MSTPLPPSAPAPAHPAASSASRGRRWFCMAACGAIATGAAGWGTRKHWLALGGGAPAGLPATALSVSEDAVCITAPAIAYDPHSGLPPSAPRAVPATARCPVCGMFPARMPRWAAQVLYADGAAHFFDSPVDLLRFRDHVSHYSPGRSASDVRSLWVTDLATAAWVPLASAWLVHGSRTLGPMRNSDLPAFANRASALAHARRHGGQVLQAREMTAALLAPLGSARQEAMRRSMHNT